MGQQVPDRAGRHLPRQPAAAGCIALPARSHGRLLTSRRARGGGLWFPAGRQDAAALCLPGMVHGLPSGHQDAGHAHPRVPRPRGGEETAAHAPGQPRAAAHGSQVPAREHPAQGRHQHRAGHGRISQPARVHHRAGSVRGRRGPLQPQRGLLPSGGFQGPHALLRRLRQDHPGLPAQGGRKLVHLDRWTSSCATRWSALPAVISTSWTWTGSWSPTERRIRA